jgi:hypothetical protein
MLDDFHVDERQRSRSMSEQLLATLARIRAHRDAQSRDPSIGNAARETVAIR